MPPPRKKRSRFPDTRWSLVGLAASPKDDVARHQALTELLSIYKPALTKFILESRRVPVDMVDDLVQDFITDKILGRKLLHHVDQRKGKFRNYLARSLNNFANTKLKKEIKYRSTVSEKELSSIPDLLMDQPTDTFDQEWVKQVVYHALDLMKAYCTEQDRMDLWDIFCMRVVDPMLHDKNPVAYIEIVRRLKIRTPRQAINLLATAKRCFLRNLKEAVGQYVQGEREINDEVADLRLIVLR